ncbi:conserved protein of unknown function [Xenorhabdus poinarii G6]|uniref:Uncharacterized protein n=1 Tax=Xenorhabdus poinarii G6 TaxID=1354304 RepID=A0A068R699_9GAMM|nr:hypothetical protein [Xenorhabdus poinarii]CDG21650.1 conserved protein of unknown function [Xenorhabdus poinarii G6]
MASVYDFERQVFGIEGVRLVIRGNGNLTLPDYPYQRRASDSTTVSEFLTNRIYPSLSGSNTQFVLVSGDGNANVHGLTLLGTLRNSYVR